MFYCNCHINASTTATVKRKKYKPSHGTAAKLSIAIMVLCRNATYANKNQLLYKKHLYTDLLNHIPYTLFLVFLFYGDGIA
jgi:hypothetical protein